MILEEYTPSSEESVGFTVMLRSIDEIVAKAKGFPRMYVIGPQVTLVSSENTGKI